MQQGAVSSSLLVRYLRVVVTTTCPMQCAFCHMEGDPQQSRQRTGLELKELKALLSVAVQTGISKFKFLGGEPLLRKDLPQLVAHLRHEAPNADISIITAGVAPEERLHALFAAGLDRANLSIHGWTLPRFLEHGRSMAQFLQRNRTLDVLLRYGRPLKLNYVYTGPEVNADLAEFLLWAKTNPVTINILDDLKNEDYSSQIIEEVLISMCGPYAQRRVEPDPNSLSTEHLFWADGLRVELKTQQLGKVAPWRACQNCSVRSKCREGIHALRLTHQGTLQPCMDRPDLGVPLLSALEQAQENAKSAWLEFLQQQSPTT